MRVQLGVVAAFAAAGLCLAPTGRADPPTVTTVTSATTTTAAAATATTVGATTDTQTTVAATDTATVAPATVPATAASLPVNSAASPVQFIDRGCLVGAVALLLPGRVPLVLGPVAQAPRLAVAALSRLVYPADGSIVSATAIVLDETGCGSAHPVSGQSRLRSLSLFAGAITARTVLLKANEVGQADAISGLEIDGKATRVRPGARVPLQHWGYLVTDARQRLHGLSGSGMRLHASGIAVHLLRPHAGLPAGAVLLVTFAGLPTQPGAAPAQGLTAAAARATRGAKATRTHKRRASAQKDRPLKVTPALGLAHYIFPVVGAGEFVDTYGAFRSDVPGNWHHGDDIFAPLGTPVVAVAAGTLNRVGWEAVGGWRLWVRDSLGNEFYYAHLSGYASAALHSNSIKAGQVIGFVGNTGDAFTTSPHVHFEIHPRTLLRLHYNGAVDPTSYLDHWTHLKHVTAPRPEHPPLPPGPVRREASYVFRELLAARHLIKHAPPPRERPHVQVPGTNGPPVAPRLPPSESAPWLAPIRHGGAPSPAMVALLAALGSLVVFAITISLPSLRRRLERRTSL